MATGTAVDGFYRQYKFIYLKRIPPVFHRPIRKSPQAMAMT